MFLRRRRAGYLEGSNQPGVLAQCVKAPIRVLRSRSRDDLVIRPHAVVRIRVVLKEQVRVPRGILHGMNVDAAHVTDSDSED